MKTYIKIMLALAVFLPSSCGNTQPEYSQTAIFFIFDNSTHLDTSLMTAMNSASPGVFCSISRGTGADNKTIYFKNNLGANSEKNLTALDVQRTIILGYNNGIIVGFGNMSDPITFYAYDSQCPNCFDPNAIPMRSYPLTIDNTGMATCNTCDRAYNMNTGGNIAKGDSGKKLTRYHASTTGPTGVLSVN